MRYTPFAIGLLLLMMSYLVAEPATQPAAPLSMKVKLAKDAVKADEYPDVTITFTNHSDKPLTIMRPIDGADLGWRVVSYQWTTTDAQDQPPAKQVIGRCGNVNRIIATDFVEIPAGKSVTVERYFLLSPNMGIAAKPGDRFQTTLTYTYKKGTPDNGIKLGEDTPEAKKLMEKAWEGTVRSEPVTFQIVP